jgi:hypothetical protein
MSQQTQRSRSAEKSQIRPGRCRRPKCFLWRRPAAVGRSRLRASSSPQLRPLCRERLFIPVIAAVAIARQRTAPALEVGRTHVTEHQHAVLEMPPHQAVLYPLLPVDQPIELVIRLALVHLAQAENRTQARGNAGGRRRGIEAALEARRVRRLNPRANAGADERAPPSRRCRRPNPALLG